MERLMGALENARELVSRVIEQLDVDATSKHVSDDVWVFTRGSATGSVRIMPNAENEEQSLVVVAMNVLRVPPQHSLAVYRKLLELSYTIRGRAAFALTDDDKIVLMASRVIEDLDESEVIDLIYQTAVLADEYDDKLAEHFSNVRW